MKVHRKNIFNAFAVDVQTVPTPVILEFNNQVKIWISTVRIQTDLLAQ